MIQTRLSGAARLLYLGPFVTMLDRFSIGPLLLPIALTFKAPLESATIALTAYLLLYGAMQPVYGLLSDRFGRVRVMRGALFGASLTGFCATLAPSLPLLIASRAATGALICGVFPTALVYVGDTFSFGVRQRVVADLLAAVALGTAAGTLGAGLFAHYLTWRLAFLLPAILAMLLVFALRWLPEPAGQATSGGVAAQLSSVFSQPWAVFLVAISIVEGAAMLGFTTFLAPALETSGQNAATAGLVTAGYGVSVLGFTRLVRRVPTSSPAYRLILVGGCMLFACYALAAVTRLVPAILAASVLAGGGYAMMHSTFQTWATEVVPAARGTATSLFAIGAFLGAGLGTLAVAPLAGANQFSTLFWLGAAATAPVVVVGAIARWRYPGAGSQELVAAD